MMPGMMMIMNVLTVGIVWFGAHKIDQGTMQVGSMTAFITYAMMIVMAFLMLAAMSIMLPRAAVAAGVLMRSSARSPRSRNQCSRRKKKNTAA